MITHALRSPAPRRALALLLACALLLTGTTAFAASGTEQQVTPAQARRDVATAYAAYQAAQAKVGRHRRPGRPGHQPPRTPRPSAPPGCARRSSRTTAACWTPSTTSCPATRASTTPRPRPPTPRPRADLETMVQGALADAIAETESTRQAWEKARRRQEQAEQQWSARQFADAAIARAQFQKSYAVRDRAQDRRNKLALRAWTVYLSRLADAGVTPPAAAKLADPDRLPATLEPVRGTGGAARPRRRPEAGHRQRAHRALLRDRRGRLRVPPPGRAAAGARRRRRRDVLLRRLRRPGLGQHHDDPARRRRRPVERAARGAQGLPPGRRRRRARREEDRPRPDRRLRRRGPGADGRRAHRHRRRPAAARGEPPRRAPRHGPGRAAPPPTRRTAASAARTSPSSPRPPAPRSPACPASPARSPPAAR